MMDARAVGVIPEGVVGLTIGQVPTSADKSADITRVSDPDLSGEAVALSLGIVVGILYCNRDKYRIPDSGVDDLIKFCNSSTPVIR
jgi:hypothetical protein